MATVKIVHYKSKKYADGSSPILLRISKNSDSSYCKIGKEEYNVFANQWDAEFGLFKHDKRLNPDHVKLNAYIGKKKAEAVKIIADFDEKKTDWTIYMFEQKFKNVFRTEYVGHFIEGRIEYFKSHERFGTARTLEGTLALLKKSNPSFDKLRFPDINFEFIEKFEKFLKIDHKCNSTTIGFAMKDIRTTLNEAINQGLGCKESYMFSNRYGALKIYKISKLVVKNRKKFIPKEFLIQIQQTDFEEPHLNWAKNLFLFSFFASGLNFKDMSSLTKDHINKILCDGKDEKPFIVLFRSKTGSKLEIPINSQVKQLLDWFDANYSEKKDYLLPIITNHKLEGEKLNEHIICRRKRYNKHLKTIANKLDFPDAISDISSYFARHSYATSMLRKGKSVELISQALGHADTKTTTAYLGGFDPNDIFEANDSLLD